MVFAAPAAHATIAQNVGEQIGEGAGLNELRSTHLTRNSALHRPSVHHLNSPVGWDRRYADGRQASGTFVHTARGNALFYRSKFHALDRCLTVLRTDLRDKSVLDAASGSGQFIAYYLSRGVRHIANADFSKVALEFVSVRFPDDPRVSVRLLDLRVPWVEAPPEFDFALVMEAIFLLPTDEDLAQAIRNLASALRPGGHAIISDIFPAEAFRENEYVFRRSRAMFERYLSESGLEIVAFVPQTFVFNRQLFGRAQRWLERAGSLLYWLDRAAVQVNLKPSPNSRANTKYLLARRRED